jgi:hypothetical protein
MSTNQEKMIIITTNEDIIRQFSSKQIKDTHVIHFNDNKQLTTVNEVYKRAFDSLDEDQLESVKSLKKSSDYICAICGDHAIGFNYDVLSCASCRIFFHRNANQNIVSIVFLRSSDEFL